MQKNHRQAIPTETDPSPVVSGAAPETSLPRTALDIPGLGPIRVRALQKAGLGSLVDLRAATLDQLMVVPGMSEVKARHIIAYLEQFPAELLAREEQTERQVETPGTQSVPKSIVEPQGELMPLTQCMSQTIGMVIALMMAEPAGDYRGRLLREMARLLHRGRQLLELQTLSEKRQARAMRALQPLQEPLQAAVATPGLDRKEQQRLADILADAADRLAALMDRVVTRATVEEADD